jgi:hypothetical protein
MKFIGYGFASSLVGLVFYFATKDIVNDGIGFGAIIIMWQLFIGIAYLNEIEFQKALNKEYYC